MPIADLLPDRCTIQARTVTAGRNDAESWASQASQTPCRLLKRSAARFDHKTAQHVTVVSSRFVLPASAVIAVRDRILHEGRVYEVVEVVEPFDAAKKHHKVAVCEAFAGSV